MFKIDTYGASPSNEFVDKDIDASVPGTRVSAGWLNALQREIIAILTAAGATPDKANDHQVVDAINYLISQGAGGGGGGSEYWKDAVANPGSLPTTDVLTGAIALSASDNTLYRYNGTVWVLFFRLADLQAAATAVRLNDSQTLTNKTLTAPVITSPTGIVKADVGLGAVENAAASGLYLPLTQKGANLGVAPLDGGGKVPTANLPSSVLGGNSYQGTFVPASGYPASPSKGFYYVASAQGVVSGTDYEIGDWAVYNGTTWDKIDNSDKVSAVDGQTGAVNLSTVYQAKDADLTALAAFTGTGTPKRTAADTWTLQSVIPLIDGGTGGSTALAGANTFGGSLPLPVSTSTVTLVAGREYIIDSSSYPITATLPPASSGARVRIRDSKRVWHLNNVTLVPDGTDTIAGGAEGASLVCDVQGGWGDFVAQNGNWTMVSMASTLYAGGSGGLTPVNKGSNFTAVNYQTNLIDLTGGTVTGTLPVTASAAVVSFIDKLGLGSATSFIRVTPGSGDKIADNAIGVSETFKYKLAAVTYYKAAGSNTWYAHYQLLGLGGSSSGSGGLTPDQVSALPTTLVTNTNYPVAQTATTTGILPVTGLASTIKVYDAIGACSDTKRINIRPGTGDTIRYNGASITPSDDFAMRRPYVSAEFSKEAGSSVWDVQYQTVSGVGTAAQLGFQRLNTNNGNGSTGTAIKRYLNVGVMQGSGFTYADSATAGGSVTITESGVFSFMVTDQFSTASNFGLTRNQTSALSTTIVGVTIAERLGVVTTPTASFTASLSYTGYFSAGDIVRVVNENAGGGATAAFSTLTIQQIAKG